MNPFAYLLPSQDNTATRIVVYDSKNKEEYQKESFISIPRIGELILFKGVRRMVIMIEHIPSKGIWIKVED